MQRALWLLATALFTPFLWCQAELTRYIPALGYGPNVWSIIRFTNSSAMAQSARLDVYREDGTRLPIGPTVEIQPGATVDIRIDGATAMDEACWARVAVPADVDARGILEILEGNALEDFPRDTHELSDRARWVALTSGVEGKYLYFLNGAGQPTVVSFCAANQAQPDACRKKGSKAISFPLGPNQSIGIQVRKPRQKFFITESSMPGAALLVLFDTGPGSRKFFGSKSTIEFGEP